ncbi:MAG: ABC transporter permease [Candidatus Sumerlaeaceae bacterium]|nr:ABC transporter permease [Candidatus Sumerlaeaceae bacterium]
MPIYDQTFRHYEGPRSFAALWWPVARNTMQPIYKSKLARFLIGGILLPVLAVSVMFFVTAKIKDVAPDRIEQAQEIAQASQVPLFGKKYNINTLLFDFLRGESAVIWLLIMAGSACIASDRRNTALPLYFSRPLTMKDYIIGKVLGLAIVPVAGLSLAVIIIYVQFTAYFCTLQEGLTQLPLVFIALFVILLVCLLSALSMAAFSSMTNNPRVASIIYIAFWLLSTMLGPMLAGAFRKPNWAALSPAASMTEVMITLMHPNRLSSRYAREILSVPWQLAAPALAGWLLVFLWIIRRNLRVVEVVK